MTTAGSKSYWTSCVKLAKKEKKMMPVVMELTREGATNGEVTRVFREIWGIWELPIKI